MIETPREIRENLIIQWYEKKLNRDELLKVLEGSEILNSKDKEKKEIQNEIIENFYENFEKAKERKEFKEADKLYSKIKNTKRQIIKKETELIDKRKSSEKPLQEIDDQMLELAEVAMSLEDGSFWKKSKLKKAKEKREELERQQNQIKGEIHKISGEKESLLSQLKDQEKDYGPKIARPKINGKKIGTIINPKEKFKDEIPLKKYKERYMKIIKEKEEFLQNFLAEIGSMDLGLSEEKKIEVVELLKTSMEKEIESMKGGDEITKLADEEEKRFKKNRENYIEELNELEGKIVEKEDEINQIVKKGEGANADDILKIKEEEFLKKKELIEIKDKFNALKADLGERLKKYSGETLQF